MSFIENLTGKFQGYGGCKRCGDRWNWKTEHNTEYTEEGNGCFPLCEECWKSLTPEERLPYYKKLWNQWFHQSQGRYELPDWNLIEKAVLEGK